MTKHKSVLLQESVSALKVKPEGKYIDCNIGGGGHTSEILKRGGYVLGIDLDETAIDYCRKVFSQEINDKKLFLDKTNFKYIEEAAERVGWGKEEVDGIIYDLGLSMFQLKDENKGFSFLDDAELDMRFDDDLNVKAQDLIKVLNEKQLEDLILEFGEEPQAKAFAHAIKQYSVGKDRIIASELAEVIKRTSKYKDSRIHPATRVFQALRIAVNSELENLTASVGRATPLLKPEGRLAIISFHSLEDKIAKKLAESPELKKVNKKPIVASEEEINENPSSRSAKLRIYEKMHKLL